MTEITAARYGTKWGYADSETGWGIGVNHDLSMIDTMICAYVLSATTGTPPSTPTDGDTYAIPATGTAGVWIGHESHIAAWMDSAWRYFSIPTGFRARFASPAGFYYWNGAAWVDETAGSTAVTSVAGRTGAVVIALSDISGAAPLSSPAFTGTPTAPTAATGTNTTQVATTAFVRAQIATGTVTSVASRTGAITLAVADVSGAAPLASPALTGNPTAPTQTAGNNSTRLATTAYADAAAAAAASGVTAPVSSVAGRTGAVTLAVADVTGAAPLASPALTGNPTAPTQTAGNNSTRLATTAYADAAAAAAAAGVTGAVSSVAGRTGAITLAVADVSGAAPLASPALTGSPTAPTQTALDNSTKVATTAYVDALPKPYDIGFYIEGVMTATEEIFRFVAPRAFTLPTGSNFAVAKALTAATGSAVITIYKNGVSCATLTWAAAGTVATVASASGASIAIGDVVSANGPGTPDPTLANIAVTLAGAR